MAKRRRSDDDGSLDSLLDTMTNVVGILVIVLVVTQLGVRDAVDRIAESESVDPAALEKAEAELAALLPERTSLQERVKALAGSQKLDANAARREQARLQKQLRDARADLASLATGRDEARLEAEATLADIEKLKEAQDKAAEELRKKVDDALSQLAKLEAQLDETPVPELPAAKIVHLPNPRPAPEGAKPYTFLCREGRIVPVDVDIQLARVQKKVESIIVKGRLATNPQAGIDCGKIVEAFENDSTLRHNDFEFKILVQGRNPYLVFARKEEAGYTLDQIERSNSRYQAKLRQLNPKQNYARFLVWPDSFDVYLVARQMAAKRGLLAGWQPQTNPAEYKVALGGKLRCGPPPKPVPPGQQPPKPKPGPPTRPPPVDTID